MMSKSLLVLLWHLFDYKFGELLCQLIIVLIIE